MKAKTDWKTIAQPWILGCLFPLSWRSKRKIILKKRLSAAISLIPEDGLLSPNQPSKPFKLNLWWGHVHYTRGQPVLVEGFLSSFLVSISHLALSFFQQRDPTRGPRFKASSWGSAALWKLKSILSGAEKGNDPGEQSPKGSKSVEQPHGYFFCCYTEFHLHKSHFQFGTVTAVSIGSA